jgi:hypothetical protein
MGHDRGGRKSRPRKSANHSAGTSSGVNLKLNPKVKV